MNLSQKEQLGKGQDFLGGVEGGGCSKPAQLQLCSPWGGEQHQLRAEHGELCFTGG